MNKLGKAAVALAMAFSVGTAFGYTSASYVQDGLIAQWDGIDNAGRGLHRTSPSVWKDLVGSNDLTVTPRSGSVGGLWGENYFDVAGSSAVGASAAPAYRTIEVVYRMTTAGGRILFCSGTTKRWLLFDGSGTKAYFDGSNVATPYVPFTFSADADRQVAGVYSEGNAVVKVCDDGNVLENPSTLKNSWGAGDGKIMLGDRAKAGSGYKWYGRVYAIRLYDRELTDDEIYQNAAIDDARFFGRGRSDVLSVRTSPEECAEAIADTPFLRGLKAGDPIALPVSAEWMNAAQTVRGVCTGYQFLVNGEVRETHAFAEEEPRVATYPAVEDGDFVELVWLWDAECRAFAETKGGGVVVVDSDWFAPGDSSAFTLTATQDPSGEHIFEFVQWEDETGDVIGSSPTISGVATGPRLYTARFVTVVCVATDGDDANSGANWDYPLATLSRALEVAHDGEKIVFDDGVYSNLDITETTTIDRPLTITSRNGRDKTTLYFTFNHINCRALTVSNPDAVVRGITFLSNKAYGSDAQGSKNYGGGFLSMSAGLVDSCTIAGFSCTRAASVGVAARLSGGTICNTVMSNNYTYTSGGSSQHSTLYLEKGKAVADRCTIVDNEVAGSTSTTVNHGAVCVAGGTTLRNSLVARNKKSNKNSGVSIAANGIVDNCTIVGNTCGSTTEFGGVYAASGAIIRNTIIAGNTNQAGERNFTLLDPGANLSNCCSPDDISAYGESNKVAVPEFVDAASGDYHLAAGPCINGGEPLDWMDDKSLDLDGRPRIIGAKPDIGCYEKVAGKLTVSAVASATYGVGELSVDFTASVDGADLAGLSYKWYLSGRDEPDFSGADKESVHWDYLAPGSYTVRIEASNAAGEKAAATYEDMITVAPSVVYVSKTSTPKKPYASWETAANTIEDVMTVVGAGVTVIVGDGEYPISSVIMLDKNITLVSANGPGRTTLQPGKSGDFRLVNMSDAGADLSGFTLRSCGYQAVGMVGGGTVSNCVFRNNTGSNNTPEGTGGSGVCVSGAGNVIAHCVFSNNTISVAGGSVRYGAAVCVVDNATCAIDNCLFVQNALGVGTVEKYGSAVRFGSGSKGRVRNCLFVKNRATGTDTRGALALVGSGAVDVENCTFVGNSTSTENCAGLYANGKANIANCLFAGNTNASGVSNVWLGASATVTTCRETDDLKDFKHPSKGNYHLKGCSPALNAGTDAEWMKTATDLEGNPRIRQRAVDIGCYEDLETGFSILVR